MRTAAIVLDDWKLPTFKRILDSYGYEYEQHPGLTKDTVTLKVKTNDLAGLTLVVKAMEATAQRAKMN